MGYFRRAIEKLEPYVPGEKPDEEGYIKLNTNENPYPPSGYVEEVLRGIDDVGMLRFYPDPECRSICREAAKLYNIEPENIIVTNGSDELLSLSVRAFVDKDELAATFYPSYTLYDTLIEAQGAKILRVDFNEDFSLPMDKIDRKAKLTFVCNPNAQTGTFIRIDILRKLAACLEGVLVIDEAYVDFARANAIGLLKHCDNVIISRTLSKSYSLAGIRLGIGLGHKDLIKGLMNMKDSYNVSELSQRIGAVALKDQELMRSSVGRILRSRKWLEDQFRQIGQYVYPTDANFLLVRFGSKDRAHSMYEYLKERKILVRYFPRRRLDDCIRITVGTEDENRKLIETVKGSRIWQAKKE